MNSSDELAILRRRLSDLSDEIDRRKANPSNRNRVYTGQVYSGGSFPTTAGRWHLTHPLTISSTESEGATPTLTVDSAVSVPVLVIDGPMAIGSYLIADQINGYWVAEKGQTSTGGGGGGGAFPGCICSTAPTPLTMTATSGSCNDGLLNSCTIAYGPTPPSLSALRLGTNCYLSTTMFTDSQTGDDFYYYLGCFGAVFRVSRVFPTSVFGSPFLDSVVYYWSIGLPGNTCVPFSLTNGNIYSGGDPACVITIVE